MTKTIVIGNESPEIKPIEFNHYLSRLLKNDEPYISKDSIATPNDFKYIELICKNYVGTYDLMFGYMDPDNRRKECLLLIGKWNSGKVES
jgi:hypothetical protein